MSVRCKQKRPRHQEECHRGCQKLVGYVHKAAATEPLIEQFHINNNISLEFRHSTEYTTVKANIA